MTDAFAIPDFTFPEGFLWGSATAAHQVEGDNIHSSNWYNEQRDHKKDPTREVSGKACNHYQMYEEDIRLLQTLGHKAFRLGVEWARIEPEEGHFVQPEADHYIRELSKLKEAGIRTFVTLVHFSVPQWFEEKGSFSEMDNLKYFESYLNFILPQITPYVDFWLDLNEFNLGKAQKRLDFKFNSMLYHARGYHLIKQYSNRPVSSAHALVQYYAKRQNDPFDLALQHYMDVINHEFFFHAVRTGELVLPHKDVYFNRELKDTADFWAVNLYTREMVDARHADFSSPRYPFTRTQMIPMDFYLDEFFPECMFHDLTRLKDRPVYITENGCCCDDDDFRIVYIAEYLCAMNEAIKDGVDVRGYLYWSLLDNWEWGSFIPRFGIVDVDREHDFKRTPKKSAWFLKEIIENNGFSQEILRKYLKQMPRTDPALNKENTE